MSDLDPKTLRMMADNASTEHFLLTPFRLIQTGGKVIICIILFTAWFNFTVFGWVFNVGEYSLENRREAMCDPRAYVAIDSNCEKGTHADYELNLNQVTVSYTENSGERHTVDSYSARDGVLHLSSGFDFASMKDPNGNTPVWDAEGDPYAKFWFSLSEPGTFFPRGDDVFRRKSREMDLALRAAEVSEKRLMIAISNAKHVPFQLFLMPDAPELEIRRGVVPKGALGGDSVVTRGMCIVSECGANRDEDPNLDYVLYWGDVLWSNPSLSPVQQHAVDALMHMNTVEFWLKEAHANGVTDDEAIKTAFRADKWKIYDAVVGGMEEPN